MAAGIKDAGVVTRIASEVQDLVLMGHSVNT